MKVAVELTGSHYFQIPSMWRNWIIGLLGMWLIIASFTIKGNVFNELIVGVAVSILGFWAAAQN